MTKIKNIISKRLEKNSEVLPIKHLFTLILLFSLFIIAYLDDFFDIKFIDDLAEIAYRWADDGDKVYVALLH